MTQSIRDDCLVNLNLISQISNIMAILRIFYNHFQASPKRSEYKVEDSILTV